MKYSNKLKLTSEMKLCILCTPLLLLSQQAAHLFIEWYVTGYLGEPWRFFTLIAGACLYSVFFAGSIGLVVFTLVKLWQRLGVQVYANRVFMWATTDDK